MSHSLPPEPLKAHTADTGSSPVASTPGYPAYDNHSTPSAPKVVDDVVAIPRIGNAWWQTLVTLILPYVIVGVLMIEIEGKPVWSTIFADLNLIPPIVVVSIFGLALIWSFTVVNAIWEMIKYYSLISGSSLVVLLMTPLIWGMSAYLFSIHMAAQVASELITSIPIG